MGRSRRDISVDTLRSVCDLSVFDRSTTKARQNVCVQYMCHVVCCTVAHGILNRFWRTGTRFFSRPVDGWRVVELLKGGRSLRQVWWYARGTGNKRNDTPLFSFSRRQGGGVHQNQGTIILQMTVRFVYFVQKPDHSGLNLILTSGRRAHSKVVSSLFFVCSRLSLPAGRASKHHAALACGGLEKLFISWMLFLSSESSALIEA